MAQICEENTVPNTLFLPGSTSDAIPVSPSIGRDAIASCFIHNGFRDLGPQSELFVAS
jgi:hypothetical protein